MKIFVVRDFTRPYRGGNLNMRQLLNPLFFSRDIRHPDASRQRGARQRAKDLAAARRLKMQYVPLFYVAPPEPPEWRVGRFSDEFHQMMLTKVWRKGAL